MARGRRDLAVTILAALKERGPLSQSAVYDGVLHCNVPAERIRGILEALEEARLVHRRTHQGDNGRPATVWAAS
jgi:predicted ArsR family transcriptional regulator